MGKRGRPVKEKEWYKPFLAVLSANANVRMACQAAGLESRNTAYEAREKNPVFAAQWDEAIENACDRLEAEAFKRAQASSDTMLIFMLKAHRPEKYRDVVQVEVLNKEAEEIAKRMNLDPKAVLAEAEKIIREKNLG